MPDKNFNGCWHCGEKGHSRTKGRGKDRKPDCPAFAKLIKEKGSLPDNYEGAYEKCARKMGKQVGKM